MVSILREAKHVCVRMIMEVSVFFT